MSWLLDTLAWTAALLALVLVLRRPVSRHFGPQAAYALWALPFLRLLLPPLELPTWLAPAAPVEPTEVLPQTIPDVTYLVVNADPAAAAPVEAAQSFDWLVLLPAVWMAGVAVFLAWRYAAYFRLRRELLERARPVGEAGRVRLVETPEVASPLAFGVLDKVVALPPHFMAQYDRRARDLALEHELAHHRGHDLLVNFAVQPLFALHWFNPLSWLGWRAMRRDQEAACDARVIAVRGSAERAAYATLIAGFAAGPRIALAAPMACPVLGDKSIVHRLRSLSMADISRRRRFAGRALTGAAALALPLTASISYAEIPAPPAAPLPPAAPAAPEAGEAPLAPEAPDAPLPPEAPAAGKRVMIIRANGKGDTPREFKREFSDGAPTFYVDGKQMGEDEFRASMAAMGKDLDKLDKELKVTLKDLPKFDEKRLRVITDRAERMAALAPEVRMGCPEDGGPNASAVASANGKRVVIVCNRRVHSAALAGLRRAREQISHNSALSEEVRDEILDTLDSEIDRINDEDDG